MSTSIFDSLSGNYNFNANMSNLLLDRASITNGSYSKLMKSYTDKVGNKNALQAYKETGSTTVQTQPTLSESKAQDSKAQASRKSEWLDKHLSNYDNSAKKVKNTDPAGSAIDSKA